MLKELKHCRNVDDLECNDNVKHKARDFIKKYMAKFGEVYIRPKDDDWQNSSSASGTMDMISYMYSTTFGYSFITFYCTALWLYYVGSVLGSDPSAISWNDESAIKLLKTNKVLEPLS